MSALACSICFWGDGSSGGLKLGGGASPSFVVAGRRGASGVGVWEGSPDHAARGRCSAAAGLHLGARRPMALGGNGSGRPLPHPRARRPPPSRAVEPCVVEL